MYQFQASAIGLDMGKYTYRIASRALMAQGWSRLWNMQVEAKAPDGNVTLLPREVADHGDGAAVLPFDKTRGTTLLVRQWRAGAAFGGHDPWLLEACAGLMDGNEDPKACVGREALEELGTHIHNIRLVVDGFSSPGALSERLVLFVADYAASDRITAGGGLAAEHEDIEVVEMPLARAWDLLQQGGIKDLKTIVLLQHLKLSM